MAIEDDDFEAFKSAYSGFFGVVLLYHEYVRSDVVKIKELHKQIPLDSRLSRLYIHSIFKNLQKINSSGS